jgi:hypothetical protein
LIVVLCSEDQVFIGVERIVREIQTTVVEKDERVSIESSLIQLSEFNVAHEFDGEFQLEKCLVDPFDWRKLQTHFRNLQGATNAIQNAFGFRFVCVVTLPFLWAQDKPDSDLEASLDDLKLKSKGA